MSIFCEKRDAHGLALGSEDMEQGESLSLIQRELKKVKEWLLTDVGPMGDIEFFD